VKKVYETEELYMAQHKETSSRHMMSESPSAENAGPRGTFFEKQCFYPDK